MKLLVKLVWRDLRAHLGRTLVSVCSILVSIFLVVWMMGNVDTLLGEFKDDAKQYMGEYELAIVPQAGRPNPANSSGFRHLDWLDDLRKSPMVADLGLYEQRRFLIGSDRLDGGFDAHVRLWLGTPPQSPSLVGTNVDHAPYELSAGVWPEMSQSDQWVGVLGSACAKYYRVGVGDLMKIRIGQTVKDIKIVGLVEQSEAQPDVAMGRGSQGPAVSSLFVPQKTMEQICQSPFAPNLIQVDLKDGVSVNDFKDKYSALIKEKGGEFFDVDQMVKRLSSNRSVVQQKESAQTAVWLVLLCSVFIMFASLNIGVQQKAKQLALLRTLGFTRRQMSAYVVIESLMMCIPAMLAGIFAGLLLMLSLKGSFDWWSLLSGKTLAMVLICALGSCLLASIIPAIRASKVSVLDSFSRELGVKPWVFRPLYLILAVICLSLQPVIVFLPGLSQDVRQSLFSYVGFTSLALGACLLVPIMILGIEKLGCTCLSRLMKVPSALMKLQLSRQMGRSAGTVIAMSLGMTIFLAVQIWGYSMLVPFTPSSKTPGTLISFLHIRLTPEEIREALAQPILSGSSLSEVTILQPELGAKTKAPKTPGLSKVRSVVLAGVPIESWTQGDKAILRPDFIEGAPEQVWHELRTSKSVVVPSTFARTCDLHVGDEVYLVGLDETDRPAKKREGEAWKIAGIMDYPGWHWLTKTSGLRVKGGRSEAIFFADQKWMKNIHSAEQASFLWGETPHSVTADQLQDALGAWIRQKREGDSQQESIQPLVKALTKESVAESVTGRGDQVIFTMSQLPLIMMIIASLSVVNALMASIHARRRELSLMRIVGVSWSSLCRMIWLESLLLVTAAGALSLIVGTLAAWCSIQILQYGYVFGIITPPLHFPYIHILWVALLMVGLASLACWVALRGVKKITNLSLR